MVVVEVLWMKTVREDVKRALFRPITWCWCGTIALKKTAGGFPGFWFSFRIADFEAGFWQFTRTPVRSWSRIGSDSASNRRAMIGIV